MFREKNKINYGATPRNNTLMQLDQQAAAASTALTNAMNQPGFVFGETKTHPLPTPEPLPNTPDIEKRVQDLSAQILAANNFEKIATEAITTTPCFMKEERLEDLVNAISNQKGDFTSVIYFNGSRNRLDATFSEKDYQDQLAKLKDLAKKDKRIIVIDHLYTEDEGYDDKRTAERKKVIPMGTIRADMIDAIKSTVDFLKIKDPKIIGIDADTYKMDDNYIMGMTKALDTTRNKFLK
ncbi:MAG: hypothetical protein LBG59_05100 [Candidatus Peribacteria bacterium]|jgi:hypothetical protein|nr:hypothetical protein [Candidatus Peribacteria bacterium]